MSMSLPNLDFTRPWLRLGCTLLLFALPFFLGLWMLYCGHIQTLERQSRETSRLAVSLMERMLSHAEEANRALLPFLGKSCERSLFTLRQQVALVPFVRTVNLAGEENAYCNSLFGPIQWPDRRDNYIDGRLRLVMGSQVRANHPLLILRDNSDKGAAVSTIDGDYLRFLLKISGRPCKLLLHVGNQWLNDEGVLTDKEVTLPTLASYESSSARYPLSIYAGHESSSLLLSLWRERRWGAVLLTGTSLSFALLIWWLLGQPRSPVNELGRALRNREFVPYLQPQVASDGEQVVGAEVLMRWQHPTAGLIGPDLFIPQAETSGLIVPMTALIMEDVARELGMDRRQVPHGFHISFNIGAAHCRDAGLLAECRRFLDHFAPGQIVLVLELTERELLVADPQTLLLFRQLNEMGVRLAIDDFGTGHSSLRYLQQFHVDYLKIDKSFISRIGTESLSEHIVDNVIDLGSRLGLSLVAEGVEHPVQAQYLKTKGVTYQQGYLFGRPIPLVQFREALCQSDTDSHPVSAIAC